MQTNIVSLGLSSLSIAPDESRAPSMLKEASHEEIGEEGKPEAMHPEGDERELSYEEERHRSEDHRYSHCPTVRGSYEDAIPEEGSKGYQRYRPHPIAVFEGSAKDFLLIRQKCEEGVRDGEVEEGDGERRHSARAQDERDGLSKTLVGSGSDGFAYKGFGSIG